MRILTINDTCFSLNTLPSELETEEDIRFAVLDNSDTINPDFFFMPLIFLDSFPCPAMVLDIGGHEIAMLLEWKIVVGDPESGMDLEILPLTSLNERGFEAFLFNPISSFRSEFAPIKIVNFYNEVKWFFPKIKNGQVLCVPLTSGESPVCAYFVKDIPRQNELIDYTNLF